MVKEIEIHLEDYTQHYPTGIIVKDEEGVLHSDNAEEVNEFANIISLVANQIDYDTEVKITLNAMDIGSSNILDLLIQILESIKNNT